jgi:hypothetical protein
LLCAAFAVIAACSLDTRSGLEDPVNYSLYGHFSEGSLPVTLVGANDTFYISDSLRGALTIYNLNGSPKGDLDILRCGPSCYGYFNAASSLDVNTGRRNGDSVVVYLFFDDEHRIQLEGVDYGDSLAGTMNSWRFSPGTDPIYRGRFVARRLGPD